MEEKGKTLTGGRVVTGPLSNEVITQYPIG